MLYFSALVRLETAENVSLMQKLSSAQLKIKIERESSPAWTQEAYRYRRTAILALSDGRGSVPLSWLGARGGKEEGNPVLAWGTPSPPLLPLSVDRHLWKHYLPPSFGKYIYYVKRWEFSFNSRHLDSHVISIGGGGNVQISISKLKIFEKLSMITKDVLLHQVKIYNTHPSPQPMHRLR